MATPMSQVQRTLDYLRDVKATKPGPMLSKAIEEVEKDLAEQSTKDSEEDPEGEPERAVWISEITRAHDDFKAIPQEHRPIFFNPLTD